MSANGDGAAAAVPRSESPTRSPRSASISLQAAATMNAGLQLESPRSMLIFFFPPSFLSVIFFLPFIRCLTRASGSSSSSLSRNMPSPHHGRRRSTVLMNLQLNDPSVPGPGEMINEHTGHQTASPQPLSGSPLLADPHHHRAPSLGELHQELEAEQEAHVVGLANDSFSCMQPTNFPPKNRLLQMIRQQQLELQRLQANHPQSQNSAIDDSSAISEKSGHGTPQPSTSQVSIPTVPASGSFSRSPGTQRPRNSFDIARADLHRRSRTPSRGASPRLRSTSISAESGDWVLGGRDESAFYQAETQMLVRENQMLRHRVRELGELCKAMTQSLY